MSQRTGELRLIGEWSSGSAGPSHPRDRAAKPGGAFGWQSGASRQQFAVQSRVLDLAAYESEQRGREPGQGFVGGQDLEPDFPLRLRSIAWPPCGREMDGYAQLTKSPYLTSF
jgi:hypothetical protein